MPVAKIAISLPEDILPQIDDLAELWSSSRSHAIVRIFQEWKIIRQPHLSIVPNELDTANHRFPPVILDSDGEAA